jgi:hypothetical protein
LSVEDDDDLPFEDGLAAVSLRSSRAADVRTGSWVVYSLTRPMMDVSSQRRL